MAKKNLPARSDAPATAGERPLWQRLLLRRAKFLAEMDQVVPWRELCALIEPFYPKSGTGRPPVGLERMLRLHVLQHWFNLSERACKTVGTPLRPPSRSGAVACVTASESPQFCMLSRASESERHT